MQRRQFAREFKLEAVRLLRERGVAVAQAARDLDVHENQLRKWIKQFQSDPGQAFPGQRVIKPAIGSSADSASDSYHFSIGRALSSRPGSSWPV
jgi:transposase-like protein